MCLNHSWLRVKFCHHGAQLNAAWRGRKSLAGRSNGSYAAKREIRHRNGRYDMSGAGDKLKGKADELKGSIKEKVGDATDNRSLQAEGLKDQASGEAKQAVGDIKDAVNRPDNA